MRNPRDVFTSCSHFSRMASFLVSPGTQTEFLNIFLDGKGIQYMDCLCIAFVHFYPLCLFSLLGLIFNPETGIRRLWPLHIHINFFSSLTLVIFGSWFDHVKGWLSATEQHIMYISYEEMILVGRLQIQLKKKPASCTL